MSDLLQQIRDAVERRLAIVADHSFRDRDPDAHLAELKTASAEVEALRGRLPQDTDPDLRHFLEKQSYVKALAWFDMRSAGTPAD